jgi:hypothetical protein
MGADVRRSADASEGCGPFASFSILADALRGHLTLRQYQNVLRASDLSDDVIQPISDDDVEIVGTTLQLLPIDRCGEQN